MREWKQVPGFQNYEASNDGIVRNVKTQRALKGIPNRGYLVVKLGHPNKAFGIHQVVAWTWLGPVPTGLVVNHINGVKTDNRVGNIEYASNIDNVKHAYRTGLLSNKGASNGNAKLTDVDVARIRVLAGNGYRKCDLAKTFRVSRAHISRIVANKQRVATAS